MSAKKKVALLISGQLRTFDDPIVVESWKKFFKEYDVTTFVCCWTERGRSIGGTPLNITQFDGINEGELLEVKKVCEIFQTKNVQLLNYREWLNSDELKDWMKPQRGHWLFNGTYTAAYMRSKVAEMFKGYIEQHNAKFDGVIVTRPDMYFIRKPFQDFFDEINFLYHQNSKLNNFSPNRIYDIFMFSSQENMLKVCELYNSELFKVSINQAPPYAGGPPTACHILWAYFRFLNLQEKSFDKAYAETYRNMKDLRLLMNRYYPNDPRVWCLDE